MDGHPVDCLLNTRSEVTVIPGNLVRELPKKPITSQIRAANGTIIEMLGLVNLPVFLRGQRTSGKRRRVRPRRRTDPGN